MLFRSTFVAAALAGLASACVQQPTGALGGNPINLPNLGQVVEAGKPFTISWNPTTPGTVSIVLLRGPSENVIPIDCLAESIPNSGTFSWTPSTSLTPDVTRYGLQIVVTGTGQFQYSTQFGISNPAFSGATTSSKAATGSKSAPASTETGVKPVTQISDGQLQVPTSAVSLSRPGSSANATVTSSHSSSISSSAKLTTSSTSTSTSSRTSVTASSVTFSSSVSRNATTLLSSRTTTLTSALRTTTSAVARSANATSTSARSTATSTPLSANPNAASRAFAAGGVLGAVGMVVILLM